MISNRKKALIHVAKTSLGLSDTEYFDILYTHGAGAQSSRDLNDHTFDSVMAHFKKCGFTSAYSENMKKPPRCRVTPQKKDMMAKIEAIRGDLKLSPAYIDSMARRMFGVDAVEWCTPESLHKIISALTYHQRRRQGRPALSRRQRPGTQKKTAQKKTSENGTIHQ